MRRLYFLAVIFAALYDSLFFSKECNNTNNYYDDMCLEEFAVSIFFAMFFLLIYIYYIVFKLFKKIQFYEYCRRNMAQKDAIVFIIR